MFDRSRKNQKVRVPEYTFSLLPLSLVHFGFCTNLVEFRISSLNKLVERTARGQLAELHFWKFRKVFPYQSNNQNFFKFYCHFLGRRARGVFPVPLASRKSLWSFADWLKNGRVLRGSGRGGLQTRLPDPLKTPSDLSQADKRLYTLFGWYRPNQSSCKRCFGQLFQWWRVTQKQGLCLVAILHNNLRTSSEGGRHLRLLILCEDCHVIQINIWGCWFSLKTAMSYKEIFEAVDSL